MKRNVICTCGVALAFSGIAQLVRVVLNHLGSKQRLKKFSYVYETEPENLNYIASVKTNNRNITGND